VADPVTFAWDIVSNPTVGIPLLVLIAATTIWTYLGVPRHRWTIGEEPMAPEPDRDPVSRTYVALRRNSYATVAWQVYERLDVALVRRTSLHLTEIPWRRSKAARLGIPDPRGLESSRIALYSLYVWASQLEGNSILRRDFWRSWDGSRAVLLERLAERMAIVEHQLQRLASAP
jgi:hypothetical protein